MDAQTMFARKIAKDVYYKCRDAMPLFDELVAAVAMCKETSRVAFLSRSISELKRQMGSLDRSFSEQE